MNTRTLWKRLRRAGSFETMFGARIGIEIRLPTALLTAPKPPDPELPPDLAQDLFVGFFVPADELGGDTIYTRTVNVQEILGGPLPENTECVVPGTLTPIESLAGVPQFRWYEARESRQGEDGKYVTTPYPIAPWVLQEVALQEWQAKAHQDLAHPVLRRLEEIRTHASKKAVCVLEDGLHVSFLFKTYGGDREHLMSIARTASRAIRFAKRQKVPIRVRVS